MQVINHGIQSKEEWRSGVTTQMRISALVGSKQICIFEQWIAEGTAAPTHSHKVEEVLTVLSGIMEASLGQERATLMKNESIIIPAGTEHGFRSVGDEPLHLLAILAAPFFEAKFSANAETSVKWR